MIKSILIVDDEPQILRAFQSAFVGTDYSIQYCENGADALVCLGAHGVDLLITDVRMPGMEGLEFLRIVKEKFPRILRVILSGYMDIKLVFRALEENLAKTYWIKPWSNDEFKASILKLSELEEIFSKRALLEFFNNMNDLPTMPKMYMTISKLIGEDADVDKISKVIEKDPAIASRILRIANSAFYGTHTGSIHQSIMYIGLSNIKNLLLSHSVFEQVALQKGVFQNLWEHASRTNAIASFIYAEFLGRKIPQIYASAGLLHNIGLIVLWMRNGNSYLEAIVKEDLEVSTISELEKELFKVTHEELGAYLLNWWDVPLPIVEAALYHHRPSSNMIINKELVSVIHLAHFYAWESLGEKLFKEPLETHVFEDLGIEREVLERHIQQMEFNHK